jgi:hypothetical protein
VFGQGFDSPQLHLGRRSFSEGGLYILIPYLCNTFTFFFVVMVTITKVAQIILKKDYTAIKVAG